MDMARAECSHQLATDEERLAEQVGSKLAEFSAWGVRVVGDAHAAALHARDEADLALKGLEAGAYRRAVDGVAAAVTAACEAARSEEGRVGSLQRIKDAEALVFLIRNKGSDTGAGGNVIESSAPLRAALEAAEGRMVAFRDQRRLASVAAASELAPESPAARDALRVSDRFSAKGHGLGGNRRKTASELADGAILMDLGALAAAASGLWDAASRCQALFDQEAESARSERHKRLALIRDNFEKGGR
jgi:hypothetical protein